MVLDKKKISTDATNIWSLQKTPETTGKTIEANHFKHLEYFTNRKNNIHLLEDELKIRKNQLDKLIQKDDPAELITTSQLKQKIKNLEEEINNIKNNVDEFKYLLNAGPILFKYYDNIADADDINKKYNKSNINNIININKIKTNNVNNEYIDNKDDIIDKNNNDVINNNDDVKNNTKNKINNKIKMLNEEEDDDDFDYSDDEYTNKNNNIADISRLFSKSQTTHQLYNKTRSSRLDLLDEYKSIIDQNWVKKKKPDSIKEEFICETCDSLMYLNYKQSIYVCLTCGKEESTLIDADKPCYKDPPPEVNYFAYKRINHFNELLAQFQAKESTHIPNDVFETIKKELKIERKTVKDLTFSLVKKYLKKHSNKRYNQYYDHIYHIIYRLNGEKPLAMTPETEEKFRYLFLQIQEPFEEFRTPGRKNFISYNYVFYMFCKKLGYTEYLKYFTLLKSPEKLYEQEKIWEKIYEKKKHVFESLL